MDTSGFCRLHPALLFGFFVSAIGLGVVVQHPAYVLMSFLGAAGLLLTLRGLGRTAATLGAVLPLWLALALLNPLFNAQGERVLFLLPWGRPYTWEALVYGACLGGMLVTVLVWFSAYHVVMTEDKFGYLFGALAPSLALLLTLVFRLVPEFSKRARQILDARRCIGLGAGPGMPLKRRLAAGMTALSALTAWALEGSVVTADAMNSRGYGTGRRTQFHTWRFTRRDGLFFGVLAAGLALSLGSILSGGAAAAFVPDLQIARPTGWGLASYGVLLLAPTILNLREEWLWHFSRSNI